ncbi:hypothetical protein OCUBac02_14940 [Bosea sp. ANAM02]|nr:hypothetical protein OCUBac02_14940 [Bosea sp. ANAM02]
MLEPDPTDRLHTRHPRTLPKRRKDQPQPITGGLTFKAITAPHGANIAGDLTRKIEASAPELLFLQGVAAIATKTPHACKALIPLYTLGATVP